MHTQYLPQSTCYSMLCSYLSHNQHMLQHYSGDVAYCPTAIMEYFSVLISALLLTCVAGGPTDCRKTYQKLMEDAAAVKKSCSEASLKDCCQVRACCILVTMSSAQIVHLDQENSPLVYHWNL